MDRRGFLERTLSLIALPAGLSLIGCPRPPEATPDPQASPTPAPRGAKKLKAALVTGPGGINGAPVDALAWAGLLQARDKYGFQVRNVAVTEDIDYVGRLNELGQAGVDLIIVVGPEQRDAIREVGIRFPDVRFALIDGESLDQPNEVAYSFREEEGGLLAGALAALMSKTGVLGFVGGIERPLSRRFELGYQAGATLVRPSIQIRVAYADSVDDPEKARKVADLQMNTRADVIFQVAGKAGLGVIQAVKKRGAGHFAIGTDRDEDGLAPGRVLTSVLKRVDLAVLDVCQKVFAGIFSPGLVEQGLKEGGIALTEMKYTRSAIPASALKKLAELKAQVLDETLLVPSTQSEYDSFLANREGN